MYILWFLSKIPKMDKISNSRLKYPLKFAIVSFHLSYKIHLIVFIQSYDK
jgi:hypothetical protein